MSGLAPQGFLKRREADAIVAATRQNAIPSSGAGTRTLSFMNGTIVSAISPRRLPRGKVTPLWQIGVIMTSSTAYAFRLIAPSTVNQIVPSNYLTTGTGTISEPKYIGLKVTASQGRVETVTIESSTTPFASPPVLESLPPSEFFIALGVIGTDAKWYRFTAQTPLTVVPFVVFQSDRNPPVLGLAQRINWYSWRLQ